MASSQPVWRQTFDVADRAVAPRLEQLVKTEGFAIAVGLLVRTRAEAQKRAERYTRRMLHLLNLPAGSDINRLMRQIGELERQAAYYTRHRIVGAPEPPALKPASQLLPATELMAVRDELFDHVQRLRRDEEERLQLIAADKAAIEAEELAEKAEEIRSAARRTRGTAASPPHVVSGPGSWVLKWRG
jgi:hypothetical protein